jgi:ribonucleoside-diphosphate reductase alpha chain
VSVDADEWAEVEDYLWAHRADFTGVSLLASSGDYDYVQAPLQRVAPDMTGAKQREAWALWELLKDTMQAVDYEALCEQEDATAPLETIACAGGKCEI